ncbi:MAG: type IV pilin-like G/H family protein, partial [Dolichospermum sp.]
RMENTTFASDIALLQVNIPATSEYYSYTIATTTATPTNTTFNAAPVGTESSTLRAYAGGVSVLTNGQTSAVACMTTTVSGSAPAITFPATGPACASAANNMK